MFNITYLGHASFFIEDGDFTLLCDPWSSENLKYFNSWKVYPENKNVDWEGYFKKAKYLYVSHQHADHFDALLLAQLVKVNPDIRVLLPEFLHSGLITAFLDLGFKNFGIPPVDEIEGFRINILLSETPDRKKEDSALVISNGTEVFVHTNDCDLLQTQKEWILQEYGKVTFLAGQFSGASWYPMCYLFEPEKLRRIAKEHREKFIKLFEDNPFKAEKLIPCAGPCIFVNPQNQHLNYNNDTWGMFPDPWEVSWKTDKVYRVWPGDSFTHETISDRESPPDNKRKYIEESIVTNRSIPLCEYIEARDKFIARMNGLLPSAAWYKRHITQMVYIQVTGGDLLELDFKTIKVVDSIRKKRYYHIEIPKDLFVDAVDCEDWENVFLSMRLKLSRFPEDVYDPFVLSFFRNLNKDLLEFIGKQYDLRVDVGEMITKEGYTFQRYCPHLQYDLRTFGEIDHKEKTLMCQGHCWKWDLETGKGVNVNSCIKVKK